MRLLSNKVRMGYNRGKKEKRVRNEPEYRSLEERRAEVRLIMEKFNEMHFGPTYEPIRKLYSLFQEYIRDGQRIVVNIALPDFDRRIKGVLAVNKREDVTIALVRGA